MTITIEPKLDDLPEVDWQLVDFEAHLRSFAPDTEIGRVRENNDCPLCRWIAPHATPFERWARAVCFDGYERVRIRYVLYRVPAWAVRWQRAAVSGDGGVLRSREITAGQALAILETIKQDMAS